MAFVQDVVVDLDRFVEEEGDHRLHLGEQAHPLLHERGDRLEHRQCRVSPGEERSDALHELVDGQRADVLGVDVLQLLDVEEGRRRVDVLQPELLDDLGEGADLDAVLRTPAQERQVVDHRLGQVALGREVGDRDRVLALRQLLAAFVHQHRQVGEHLGPAEAERVAEEQVLRRAVARGPRRARRG